jgi:hypothetical protein
LSKAFQPEKYLIAFGIGQRPKPFIALHLNRGSCKLQESQAVDCLRGLLFPPESKAVRPS